MIYAVGASSAPAHTVYDGSVSEFIQDCNLSFKNYSISVCLYFQLQSTPYWPHGGQFDLNLSNTLK